MDWNDLIGKKIASVKPMKKKEYSDQYIEMCFTDKTKVIIEASYGSFNPFEISECEFPRFVLIHDDFKAELIEDKE